MDGLLRKYTGQSHLSLKEGELNKYCLWDLDCFYLVTGFRPQPLEPSSLSGSSCLPEQSPHTFTPQCYLLLREASFCSHALNFNLKNPHIRASVVCGEAQVTAVQSSSALLFLFRETPSFIIPPMNSPISYSLEAEADNDTVLCFTGKWWHLSNAVFVGILNYALLKKWPSVLSEFLLVYRSRGTSPPMWDHCWFQITHFLSFSLTFPLSFALSLHLNLNPLCCLTFLWLKLEVVT